MKEEGYLPYYIFDSIGNRYRGPLLYYILLTITSEEDGKCADFLDYTYDRTTDKIHHELLNHLNEMKCNAMFKEEIYFFYLLQLTIKFTFV